MIIAVYTEALLGLTSWQTLATCIICIIFYNESKANRHEFFCDNNKLKVRFAFKFLVIYFAEIQSKWDKQFILIYLSQFHNIYVTDALWSFV